MTMTEDKKKRRKPWDRRKHPAIRAHMEIAKKHGLQGHLTHKSVIKTTLV